MPKIMVVLIRSIAAHGLRGVQLLAVVFALLLATAHPAAAEKYLWDIDRMGMVLDTQPLLDPQGNVRYRLSSSQFNALRESRLYLQSAAGFTIDKLYILDGDKPNAYAGYGWDGSFVALNTAMLDLIGNDPDAIAAILGHEMAHLKLNHIQQRQETNSVIQVIGLIVGLAVEVAGQSQLGITGLGSKAQGLGTAIAVGAFSRDQEREADDFGTRWAASAGYSPNGAVRVHRALLALKGSGDIPFLSTHPASQERIETLERLAAELKRSSAIVTMKPAPAPPSVRQNPSDNATVAQAIPKVSDTERMKWYRRRAEQGDANAQYWLGDMYRRGKGVPQDFGEAVRLYRLAAEQGHPKAQYTLGLRYERGQGVPQDHAEAIKWYRLAANQGIAFAQNNMGMNLMLGRGISQNDTEAVRWFRLAGEQGLALAQASLGYVYNNGRGVPKDYILAYMWSSLATAQGNKIGVKNRDFAANNMTSAQIAEAQRRVAAWNPTP